MTGKVNRGIAIFAALLAIDAVLAVSSMAMAIVFTLSLSHQPLLVATAIMIALSAIFAYAIPFFLSAMFSRINMRKVIVKSAEIETTDVEKIAQALSWRIKPTKRLVRKCIKRNYI